MTDSTQEFMLSTTDNPFDPFTQFDKWTAFDESMGYYSCAYLARIAKTSDALSEEEEASTIDSAIDEIVSFNLSGRYIKVEKGKFVANRIVSSEKDINI